MKCILIVADGMSDYPVPELGGKTPLEVAKHPGMDFIASHGTCGLLSTLPNGLDTGTDVAVLSILGYDPHKYHTGRGPLEAANLNVKLNVGDLAFRCNIITVVDDKIDDHSAGHISSADCHPLIYSLNAALGKKGEIEFFPGVSFRNLLITRGGGFSDEIQCTPPHDALGKPTADILIKPRTSRGEATARFLNEMMLKSRSILQNHPINLERMRRGEKPGNMMWIWSPGKAPQLPPFHEKYGLKGAVISAVDLVNGIGAYAGMTRITVPGATGYTDTNYEGKADYALQALDTHDFVLIHVEAPDEVSHIGDYQLKIQAIEDLDRRLIRRILDSKDRWDAIAVMPDHATPITVRTHVRNLVPFAVYSRSRQPWHTADVYNEAAAANSDFKLERGEDFMKFLLNASTGRS